MSDIKDEFVRKGLDAIDRNLGRSVDKGKMTAAQMQEKLDLIEYTLNYDEFGDVDVVIEAVPEVMRIKQAALEAKRLLTEEEARQILS